MNQWVQAKVMEFKYCFKEVKPKCTVNSTSSQYSKLLFIHISTVTVLKDKKKFKIPSQQYSVNKNPDTIRTDASAI